MRDKTQELPSLENLVAETQEMGRKDDADFFKPGIGIKRCQNCF